MPGWHKGKQMADLLNWPIFRLTKLVFFRARAMLKENTVTLLEFELRKIHEVKVLLANKMTFEDFDILYII